MKINLFYFSATNNTAKIADAVANNFESYEDIEIEKTDITSFSARKNKFDLDEFDTLVFGSPIYELRAPRIVREWLTSLDSGNGKKVSTFFTYGGGTPGIAAQNANDILEERGFQVVSSGEFIGRNANNLAGWNMMEGRPNQEDLNVVKEYVEKTYLRFIGEDNRQLELPPREVSEKQADRGEAIGKKRRKEMPKPSRHGESCSMCKTCEENCPTNAMDSEIGEVDPESCIGCLRCVYNCPDKAMKAPDRSKMEAMVWKVLKLTPEIMASKKSKYYL